MKSSPPHNLGTILTVESCPRIKIDDLLKQCRDGFKETMITSQLKLMGIDIELIATETRFNGMRFWFKCPHCERRVGVLFKRPASLTVGCRLCLNLHYGKQRYKNMIEGNISLNSSI